MTKRFELVFLMFLAVTCAAGAVRSQPTTQPTPPSWAKVSKEQLAEAKKLGVPVAFENAVGIKFVLVPAGEFMMGSADDEEGRYEVEGPQRKVKVRNAFYMAIHQTTKRQWKAAMGTTPWIGEKKHNIGEGPDYPAQYVSWNDAASLCAKLAEKDRRVYSLPTEVQWEYACRAGSTTRYFYGDDPGVKKLSQYAWYLDHGWKERQHPKGVGTKKPNAWGIYDMHGNLWEFCLDIAHSDYKGAPSDERAWMKGGAAIANKEGVFSHSLRGGGMRSTDRRCRTASRYSYPAASSSYYVGFRLSCSIPAKTK